MEPQIPENVQLDNVNEPEIMQDIEPNELEQKRARYPSPFKTAMFWPQTKSGKKNKSQKPKVYPTVATSEEFMLYLKKIENEKQRKELEKEERVNKRKEMSESRINTKKQKTCKTSKANADHSNASTTHNEIGTSIENTTNACNYEKDDYVIVVYEDEFFPGIILEKLINSLRIKTMTMSGQFWKWPNKDDVLIYSVEDVQCKIKTPLRLTKRGPFNVPEIVEMRKNR